MDRDSITNKMILQGSECGGLYEFTFSSYSNRSLSTNFHISDCPLGVAELSTNHMSCSLNQLKVSLLCSIRG